MRVLWQPNSIGLAIPAQTNHTNHIANETALIHKEFSPPQ
jgi:hypothetical protein